MREITVNKKQNIIDVCLQVYGTTQLLFDFTKLNGVPIDYDVSVGEVLQYDETLGDKLIKEQISRRNLSMINPINPLIDLTEGIGIWKIGSTFIVS